MDQSIVGTLYLSGTDIHKPGSFVDSRFVAEIYLNIRSIPAITADVTFSNSCDQLYDETNSAQAAATHRNMWDSRLSRSSIKQNNKMQG